MAAMEHSAAKEHIKKIREEERQRDLPPSQPSTPVRNLDSIMDDVQSNRQNERYQGRSYERHDDRYQNRHPSRFDDRRNYDRRR